MRYTIIWDPNQLSPDAIDMMQYIVDSPLNLQLDNYYLINKGVISYGESLHNRIKWVRDVYLTLKNDCYTPRNTLSSIVKRGILWGYSGYLQLVCYMYYNISLLDTKGEFYHNKMK